MVGGLLGRVPSSSRRSCTEVAFSAAPPARIKYKFTPAEINHPYHIRESCVQNCKNKVHATPRCFRFLSWHIFGGLDKSILFTGIGYIYLLHKGDGDERGEGEAGGERCGCSVLTRGSNSCQGRDL